MSKEIRVIVLFGDGINCERETQMAFEHSGAKAEIIHINELLEKPDVLAKFDIMAIPGGFSFGDELGSGKLLALKLKYGMMSELSSFIQAQKPIIGICNGFQALMHLDVFPSFNERKTLSLIENESGNFIDRWVKLNVDEQTVCKWVDPKKVTNIKLPARHGEGNFQLRTEDEELFKNKVRESRNIVFKYDEKINGSFENIAGICDDTGLILGMMPHPEAAFFKTTSNRDFNSTLERGAGAHLFETIVKYVKGRKDGHK